LGKGRLTVLPSVLVTPFAPLVTPESSVMLFELRDAIACCGELFKDFCSSWKESGGFRWRSEGFEEQIWGAGDSYLSPNAGQNR
jgi:hypothetical protein